MSEPSLKPAAAHRHGSLVRISSVSLASVLAILIGTSVLPPLVADQSDRAVINAPVTLVTAPIAGDIGVFPISAGDAIERGSLVARIANERLDRSTAIQLAGRVSELRERAFAAENKRSSNEAYLATLAREIREQSSQMKEVLRAQVDELQAKIASAEASGAEKKVLMDRQVGMVARDVASPDMVKSTTQSFNAAVQEKKAAEAKLSQKTVQLDGLERGLFVGDDLRGLADLTQKQLSITFDTQRLAIEEKELKAAMVDQQALLDRENIRLDKLAKSEIKAASKGIVFSVNATSGRHVSAGDNLASVVDCERSFVVAIFSYRQGQNLQVGSAMTISGEPGGPRRGVVTAILPKTSDTVDAGYAVPFPQTERRELYVLVKPDPTGAQVAETKAPAETSCGIGRWVTVTRGEGWVPSTSVVWREIEARASDLVAGATALTVPANATPDRTVSVASATGRRTDEGTTTLESERTASAESGKKAEDESRSASTADASERPAATPADIPAATLAQRLSILEPPRSDLPTFSKEDATRLAKAYVPAEVERTGALPAVARPIEPIAPSSTPSRKMSMPPLPPVRPDSLSSSALGRPASAAREARG